MKTENWVLNGEITDLNNPIEVQPERKQIKIERFQEYKQPVQNGSSFDFDELVAVN